MKFIPIPILTGIEEIDNNLGFEKSKFKSFWNRFKSKISKIVEKPSFHNYLKRPILDLDLILSEAEKKTAIAIIPSLLIGLIFNSNLEV